MPYITQEERREGWEPLLAPLTRSVELECKAGSLDYLITRLCLAYVRGRGKSFATLATVVGVLVCVVLEVYRRVVAPYEDGKIRANGEVFEKDGT